MERAHGLLLAGVFIAAVVLVAQTTSTEILGTVTDPSGALVPGAKVTLLRLATGERREMSTTSTGDYSFPLIEVGEYAITVTKEGFRTQEKRGVTVALQQKARVNFDLTVGEGTQTVAVGGNVFGRKSEGAAGGRVIAEKSGGAHTVNTAISASPRQPNAG